MNLLSYKRNSPPLEEYTPECMLANWSAAVTDFYNYYHQLATCISQTTTKQDLNIRKTACIGQCPTDSLVELTSAMREELKNLSQDIDYLDELRPSSIYRYYEKLATHTRVLTQLSRQAQNKLYLVGLSS